MYNRLNPVAKAIIYLLLILICAACIIPIITVLSISLSSDATLVMEGYGILPKSFTFSAYDYIFKDVSSILRAYMVSLGVTATGLVLGLMINALIAYTLSRKDYRFRKQLTIYLAIPMILNGGIIPSYILITRYLNLKDSYWALILPILVVPWFVILLRTFFCQIPHALIEAATIDGASEIRVFLQIILPLAKPALAAVGMFITLNYWNDWYLPLMYIEDRTKYNLQYKLYIIMRDVQEMLRNMSVSGMGISIADIPTESMRMAMCVIAAGPMLVIFPFFQKYFVKGLTVGGVKG